MDSWEQPLDVRIAAAQMRMLEEIRKHPTPYCAPR
jgi:hypothetical protein